jgi:adenosylcobinamide-GDP ribazoletransferase
MSILRPLAVAFAFLTRLPVRLGHVEDTTVGRAMAFFPVVGLTLGMVLAAAAWLAGTLPSPVTAVGMIALLAGLTGGLHLDGLADVFDGLGGSHGDREHMLAIMRDSRIGAHGALALLLVVLAKVFAASVVLQRGDLWGVVLFPAVARWAVVPLIVTFPYVREVGLGRTFNDRGSAAELVWSTLFVGLMLLWAGTGALVPTAAALIVALGFAVWMRRRLGGLTGDAYGAAIELAEVVFLIAATRGG